MVAQGNSTVRAHLKELEREGFIRRERLRYSDGTLAQYRYFLDCQNSAVGDIPSAEKQISLAPEKDNPYRRDLADNNNQLTTIEQTPNPKGEYEEIFEKLWKSVLNLTPEEIKGRHIKKTAKAKFIKIASRKEVPIAASRIAHAVLWYYDQEPQKKDDRAFMKGLGPVLNSEAFAVYLDRGAFKIRTVESDKAEEWARRAKFANENGGEWPPSGPSARAMPAQYRKLVDLKHWPRLGWKPPQGGL